MRVFISMKCRLPSSSIRNSTVPALTYPISERQLSSFLPICCRISSTPVPSRDRKSTRLNSSHQIISYAVFCLKKKKTNTHSRIRYYMQEPAVAVLQLHPGLRALFQEATNLL